MQEPPSMTPVSNPKSQYGGTANTHELRGTGCGNIGSPHNSYDSCSPRRSNSIAPHDTPHTAENDILAEFIADWLEGIVVEHGGVMTSANLGSSLSSRNFSLYRIIKEHYGGLCALLSQPRFATRFVLADNAPFNHVIVHPTRQQTHTATRHKQQQASSSSSYQSRHGSTNATTLERRERNRRASDGAGCGLPENASWPERTNKNSMMRSPECKTRGLSSPRTRQRNTRQKKPYQGDGDIVEAAVVALTREILTKAANKNLRAVELANTLRGRHGPQILTRVRELHGGLLTLLEKYPSDFEVQRIPKSDCVRLVTKEPVHLYPCADEEGRTTQPPPHAAAAATTTAAATTSARPPTHGPPSLNTSTTRPHASSLADEPLATLGQLSRLSLETTDVRGTLDGPHTESSGCPILELLTSETFVPTQKWCRDPRYDGPYVKLVTDQLRAQGGSVTFSKLRSLMKKQLNEARTVKSVSLRCFLEAYNDCFSMSGRRVALIGHGTAFRAFDASNAFM
uniref:Uncharacterized protein n=1 Tax=Octactis speculum TaxID=3111310 RepID=A0A7S2D0S3_9STRA|mmetsp:Transcript_42172/g.57559  ORF Transcript_42172/g.57559 Transcript_42172/m.57559 type:complete len:512 (+) Transcript_42172:197-1732(+)